MDEEKQLERRFSTPGHRRGKGLDDSWVCVARTKRTRTDIQVYQYNEQSTTQWKNYDEVQRTAGKYRAEEDYEMRLL